MIMFNVFKKKIFVFVIFLIFPVICFGQLDMSYTLSRELDVEVIPNYPKPNDWVFIEIALYTDNLDSADITWLKDGREVVSGKGLKEFSFRTGNIGEQTDIEIRIELLNGSSFSKKMTFNPADVDLTWEANSYVPPFYKGKALHPKQGLIKIVAMPEFVKNGKRTPPEDLIYEWSNDVSVYKNQSGYGKYAVVLNGSLLGKQEKIRVLVTDPVNNLVAESFLDISPVKPEIVFYENNPFYGYIFDQALSGRFNMKSPEVQIVSSPFYFTKEDLDLIKNTWLLNGNNAPELSGSKTVVFRKPEEKSGQSSIFLRMENENRILQQAEKTLVVSFDK